MANELFNKFYVYAYLREIDSKNGKIGSPYYIGKGCGKRAFSSRRVIPKPKNKSNIQFLAENMNEVDAFQLEMLLIHLYGRIDLKTGCLRNMSDGGEFCVGMSQQRKEIIRQEQKERWKNLEYRKNLEEKLRINSEKRKGIKRPEVGKAISDAKKGKKQSPEHIAVLSKVRKGKIPWNKGKHIPWSKKAYESRGLKHA